ncbi:MAG: serine hydrolase [Actinobacteria bacterium]|nr:serine hydrolase [Actinomycetota bacterium]
MDRIRSTTTDNWLDDPYPSRAFQRVREFAPSARVANDSGVVSELPVDLRELGGVELEAVDGSTTTVDQQFASSNGEGLVVLKDGVIVYERYANGMEPRTPHLCMSVTKSFVGAMLGIQVGKGLVRMDQPVTELAPEFIGTSLDGANVRHVIDMTAGTEFVEDYDLYEDPSASNPLIDYERQASYRRLGAAEPLGMYGHFRTYPKTREHGTNFDYRSVLTNIAARIVENVTGQRFVDALSEQLWVPLGMEHEADMLLDVVGDAVVDGGLSCSTRDLARFALAYQRDGQGVIPADWVADTRDGDDEAVRNFAESPTMTNADRGDWSMYRNAFWVIERGTRYTGSGIYGQHCFVDHPSKVVVARFSTYPLPYPVDQWNETMRAITALSDALA